MNFYHGRARNTEIRPWGRVAWLMVAVILGAALAARFLKGGSMFSDDDVAKAWEMFRKEGMWQVMALAVELAARGGTMTAEDLRDALAKIDALPMPKDWERDYNADVTDHVTAMGARVAVLEAENQQLRASNDRLLAASSAFTHELDTRGGLAPSCSNPDPTTGPTCTDRGCEGQTCQYPRTLR